MITRVALCALCVWYIVTTFALVRAWSSEWALAVHVAERAPEKPRALVNLARAALLRGDLEVASAALDCAERAAARPWVPAWDREDARSAVAANRRLLSVL